MNELQIKTIESIPAKIEFNKEQLINELNITLKKYEGLVFTEDNTPEIRRVLAELRKGKKAANDYRLSIKRELIAPVTEFESDVKDITKLFDDVINPINDQLKEFEEKRRNEKRKEIELIIKETIESVGLNEKYASRLIVEDHHLTKSASIRTTKESIEFKANNLLNEQKVEEMNKESIEMFVKLKNSENNLNLSVTAYLSQLEYKDVEEVKKTIESDVKRELERQKTKKEAKQVVESEVTEQVEKTEEDKVVNSESIKFKVPEITKVDTKDTTPATYTVFATEEQHQLLIDFMNSNKIEFVEEMELPF